MQKFTVKLKKLIDKSYLLIYLPPGNYTLVIILNQRLY
jgi:hypothetical protein